MSDQELTIQSMPIDDVGSWLSEVTTTVSRGKSRVLIEKDGTPVAAIVSVADFERLARLDRKRDELWEAVDRLREAFKDVPVEEIEREADRAVAEIRNKLPARA
jgi:prevent-host-death family protein